jgi:methyl coenzyme M reductase gamma subunit
MSTRLLSDLCSDYPNDEDLGRNVRKHMWNLFEIRKKRLIKIENVLKLLSQKNK